MKNHYDRAIYFESLYPYLSRGWAPIRGIIHNFTKYIDSPIPEVYDLKNDFGEADNLSANLDLAVFKNQLSRIEKRIMENHGIPFSYDDAVLDLVNSRCTEVESGARAVDAILTHTLLPQISGEVLARMMQGDELKRIHIGVKDDDFDYAFD